MNKMINSAELVNTFQSVFKCTVCSSSMQVVNQKSLICANRHTFDFTKSGYLNLLNHSVKSQYNKPLFEARHKMIAESELYAPMHEIIVNLMKEHIAAPTTPMVADLGCGEGSHLHSIMSRFKKTSLTGFGLDISKEAISMASRRYDHPIWLVSDLANMPFKDQSFHAIINILSPSNYKEFMRILVQDGLVIKVVPRSNYLMELREVLFKSKDKKMYKNDETVKLFKQHFHLRDVIPLNYSRLLNKAELVNLVQMTPLAWKSEKACIDSYINQDAAQITIDVELLVGLKS